ncbi:MAG: nucleotidyl transferase AbiEii/AbiGii toxin family protein [Candidatus Sulfotelmatobacter sp.]
MIADQEIEQKAAEFSIFPTDVEKDYVFRWLLKSIYARPALASRLVLKGGQAIRKAYIGQTRFSKDLDFSLTEPLDPDFIQRELRQVCADVTAATGVNFLDQMLIKDKNLPIEGVEALEVRLYFKGFYGEWDLNLKAQLDITQFERIYLPVQSRMLLHPYSDASQCAAAIRTHKLEEILASKLTAMLHRRKPVDLFDLLHSILIARDYPVSRLEVVSTFLKKSIFGPQPNLAKEQILAIPMTDYESDWSSLLVPAGALMAFSFVLSNFRSLIDSLFALIVPTVVAPSIARVAGIPTGLRNVPRGIAAPRGISGFQGVNPLRADTRQVLKSAARNRHLVDMMYDGFRRLIEPYKLEYYVRKSDGHGSEYFWGYDRSGGKSRRVSMKQFFCHKIASASETATSFVPQYPIEL